MSKTSLIEGDCLLLLPESIEYAGQIFYDVNWQLSTVTAGFDNGLLAGTEKDNSDLLG